MTSLSLSLDELLILIPALLAGVLVLATHVPLGQQVLKRGIIFIDLAIAQIAGLGVIIVHRFTDHSHGWLVQLAAFTAALTAAWALHQVEKRWPDIQEALIGVAFVLAVSAALLLLANDPHGAEHLKDLLSGQLLWVSYSDLWIPAVVSVLVLVLWFTLDASNKPGLFYPLFAVSVTTSVQLVGVYLVFASLIIPALAARHNQASKPTRGWLIGLIGYVLGLLASVWLDLPTGPLIVWSLALVALLTGLLSSRNRNESTSPTA